MEDKIVTAADRERIYQHLDQLQAITGAYAAMFEDLRALLLSEATLIKNSEQGREGLDMTEANKAKLDLLQKISEIMKTADDTAKAARNGS